MEDRRRRTLQLLSVWTTVLLVAVGCGGSGESSSGSSQDEPVDTMVEPAAAPLASSGCDREDRTGADTGSDTDGGRRTVVVDGTERWYLLSTPTGASTPRPLVIDFHGLAEGAEFHATMTGLGELAAEQGFILATPNGTGEPVSWGIGIDPAGADLRFVDAMIDELAATDCIDLSRVYATGLSNGALLSSALACAASDRIAAVATVAGLADPPGCSPGRSVPVLNFHGTDDAILLFNGGVGDLGTALGGGSPSLPDGYRADLAGPGVPAAEAGWAERNGCGVTPADERVAEDVIRRTYPCPPGTEVVSYVIEGGGHSWPGSEVSATLERVVGRTTTSIDANRVLWEFFQRHRLPANTTDGT